MIRPLLPETIHPQGADLGVPETRILSHFVFPCVFPGLTLSDFRSPMTAQHTLAYQLLIIKVGSLPMTMGFATAAQWLPRKTRRMDSSIQLRM